MSSREFKRLATRAAQHVLEDVAQFAGFLTDHPKYALEGCSILYDQLDPKYLPRGKDSEEDEQNSINIAILCLRVLLGEQFVSQPPIRRILQRQWPCVWCWTDTLAQGCLVTANAGIGTGRLVLKAALESLELVYALLVLKAPDSVTLDFVTTSFQLWVGMSENKSLRHSMEETGDLVLNLRMCVDYVTGMLSHHDPSPAMPSFKQLVQDDPPRLLRAALYHCYHGIPSGERMEGLDIAKQIDLGTSVLTTLHVIFEAADKRQSVPFIRTIPLAMSLLSMIASQALDYSDALRTLGNVKTCLAHVFYAATTRVAKRCVALAFDHGIIESLVSMRPLLLWASEQAGAVREHIKVFEGILAYSISPYLLYGRVIRTMANTLRKLGEDAEILAERDMGLLSSAWEVMLTSFNCFGDVVSLSPLPCYWIECENTEWNSHIRMCGGCRNAFYCSHACQKSDWRSGSHRKQCFAMQRQRMDNPAYSYLRKLEFDFREAIVVGTLTKTDGVVDDVLTAGMPQGTPLLELSYLHMPTVLTLTTVEDAKLSEWQGETEETEAWRNGECGKSDMRVRALMRAGVVDIQMLTIVGDLLG